MRERFLIRSRRPPSSSLAMGLELPASQPASQPASCALFVRALARLSIVRGKTEKKPHCLTFHFKFAIDILSLRGCTSAAINVAVLTAVAARQPAELTTAPAAVSAAE